MENYVEKINWEKFKKPIVIETVTLNEDSENYLFKKQLDAVKEMLNHFDNEKDSKGEVISRNISIAGERGSGKTSFLKSLKNILSKEYHVFDIIGPELLSSNLGITTIFLSMLNTLLEERSKDIDSNLNKFSIVKKQMKQATAAISVEKQQDDYFKNGNAESEILRALTDRVKLDEVMSKLLEEIKELIKGEEKEKKDFVLIIDDLDLVKNSQVSQLLTEIQRYLDKKLIIIFAYRERQLENSLFEDRFNDNKNLIGQKIIESDELYSQIEQFLIKLVPYGNRIKLFNQDDVLNLEIDEVLNSLGTTEKKKYVIDNNLHIILHDKSSSDSKTGLTVEKWFYDYIHRHTDLYIKPVDTREDTHQFLPRSLRELIQCFEVFDKMILPTRDDGITTFLKRILGNLKLLEQYKNFRVESYFSTDRKKIAYFEEWEASQPFRKNKLTYDFVFHNYDESFIQEDLGYPFNLSKREEYNLTLGDILSLIEHYKYYNANKCQTNELYFFYIVKLNYSLYLSKLFIESTLDYYGNLKSDSKNTERYNDSKIESYLQIINTKFMPSEFNYLSNNTKWNKDEYILTYNPKNVSDISDKTEVLEKFVSQFFYSDITAKGDISSHIHQGYFISPFRFRELYNYKDIKTNSGYTYMFDFYVACNKEEYIKKAIKEFEGRAFNHFIFKNIFQVDLFIRKNYFSKKETAFKDALEGVNKIIAGNKGEKEGYLDFKSLKTILYLSSTNQSNDDEVFKNFDPLYDVKEILPIYNKLIKIKMKMDRKNLNKFIKSSVNANKSKRYLRYMNDLEKYYINGDLRNRDLSLSEVVETNSKSTNKLSDNSFSNAKYKLGRIFGRKITARGYKALSKIIDDIFKEYELDENEKEEVNDIVKKIQSKINISATVEQINNLYHNIKDKENKEDL